VKKLLLATAATIALLASVPSNAQTFSNGPYYANPAWDQTLTPTQRFIVLTNFNSQAVLDRETGLVWQRTPGNGPTNLVDTWTGAMFQCHRLGTLSNAGQPIVINRLGWRLPSVEELASLFDPTQSAGLPPGHPFLGVPTVAANDIFWTSTEFESFASAAYTVKFVNELSFSGVSVSQKTEDRAFWCVRGGQSTTAPTNQ
jgi:hypothetical protein